MSRNYREVLGVLLSFAVKRGRGVSVIGYDCPHGDVQPSTVLRAIAWLALYGFLDKLRRIVSKQGLLGPRIVQTSTLTVLHFPKDLGGLAVNIFNISPDRHNSPPSESNR